jgi:hypothetical protein
MTEDEKEFMADVVNLQQHITDIISHAERYNRSEYEHKKQDALGRIEQLKKHCDEILEEHE